MTAANLLRHRFRRSQVKITPFISTDEILEFPHLVAEFAHAATHRSVGGVNHPVVLAVFGWHFHVGHNTTEHGMWFHVDEIVQSVTNSQSFCCGRCMKPF